MSADAVPEGIGEMDMKLFKELTKDVMPTVNEGHVE